MERCASRGESGIDYVRWHEHLSDNDFDSVRSLPMFDGSELSYW
jgi:hypothetical protein